MQYIEGQALASLIQELRCRGGREPPTEPAPDRSAGALAGELTSGRWLPRRADDIHGASSHGVKHTPTAQEESASSVSTQAAAVLSTGAATRTPLFFRTIASPG